MVYNKEDPPLGNWHYEWREITNPYADFDQTKLYEILANVFANKTHTHQKSDITDFTHNHNSWQSQSIGTATLYYNTDLRLAELRWKFVNTSSRTANSDYTYTGGTIPSTYLPSDGVYPSATSQTGNAVLRIDTNGSLIIRFLSAISSTSSNPYNYHFNTMWHY